MTGWTWAAARRRGTSHLRAGTPCQDALRCVAVAGRLVAAVSDGAGSAAYGGWGAALTACSFVSRFRDVREPVPDDAVTEWLDEVRTRIAAAAERRGVAPRDFAATLVACIASPSETLLALVGDGAAAVRTAEGWSVPSWPENGEYASTTFFVTDQPLARLRLVRVGRPVDAVALMSDGLERLALDFGTMAPHAPFFDAMIRPVAASAAPGRDPGLSRGLAAWMDGEAVSARTDDDKSLVLAHRR